MLKMPWSVGVLIACFLAITMYTTHLHKQNRDRLNTMMSRLFLDYCSTRGGVSQFFNVKATAEEIDAIGDVIYLGCTGFPGGFLVIQNNRVIFYVPQQK